MRGGRANELAHVVLNPPVIVVSRSTTQMAKPVPASNRSFESVPSARAVRSRQTDRVGNGDGTERDQRVVRVVERLDGLSHGRPLGRPAPPANQ